MPIDHSDSGWFDNALISGMPATTRTASRPMVVKAEVSWCGAVAERRYRCRMKPYQAAKRASSSQPLAPVKGVCQAAATAAHQIVVIRQAPASQAPVRLRGWRARISNVSAP